MNQRLTALVLCGFLAAPSLSFAAAASPSASKDAAPAAVVKSSPKEEGGVFQKDHVLIVNGKTLDAASLPTPVLVRQKETMVPLRLVAEALGYTVSWNPETASSKLDMSIASMEFRPGETLYQRKGKLKVINLDAAYKFTNAPQVVEGVTYVPVSLFGVFFNEVKIEGKTISITVQKSQLQDAARLLTEAAAEKSQTQAPNPMVEYSSLTEMEKKVGHTIKVPASLKNKKVAGMALPRSTMQMDPCTGHKRDRLVISVGITPSMPLIPIGSMVPIKSAAAVIKMPTGPLLGKMASIPIPIIPRAR